MNDHQDDEALARVRAADPAAGSHPDLHRISQRLRGRTPLGSGSHNNGSGGAGAGYSFSDVSDTAIRINDPQARTSRVGFVVAASVAALALGGGGYLMGAVTGGDDGGARTTAATTGSVDQHSDGQSQRQGQDDAAPQDQFAGAADGATDEPTSAEASMSDEAGGGYAGPIIPVAGEQLSTERSTGMVYAVGAGDASQDARTLLEGYAGLLGVQGKVEADGDWASVTDASDARSLNVYVQAGNPTIDYSNPALDPYCQTYNTDGGNWFGQGGPDSITCQPGSEAPEEAFAIDSAEAFVTELGLDPAGFEFTVDSNDVTTYGDDMAWATEEPDSSSPQLSVTAQRTSTPVGSYHALNFGVTDQGVYYANLPLGELQSLGEYPVISPVEAVERASDTRFQQIGAWIPDLEWSAASIEEWQEPKALPAIQAGDPIPYPVSQATVTGAELHQGVVSLYDGTEFVAPVYNLTDDQGNSWQVMALTEESLDFTP